MPAQIRPNRLDVNDRFPMLGFTIRTGGQPRLAEVAVATDPTLLAPEGRPRRTASNFYSSRAGGRLEVPGDAVYVLPPDALARVVGAEKLYVGLATSPVGSPPRFTTDVMPSANSPYVSIKSLTGRSLRRLRVIPGRGRPGTGGPLLEWAGDAAQPGQQPAATPANGAAPAAAPAAPHYDDGFGPLPPAAAPPAAAATPPSTAPAAPAPRLSCPRLSGPSTMIVWTAKGTTNAEQEAQAGRDHREAA